MNREIYNKYATILVKVGINLQPQQIVIINAPPESYELVREITRVSYENKAKLVHVIYEDEYLNAIRLKYSEKDYLSYYPKWLSNYMSSYASDNIRIINLRSPNPHLFDNIDEEKIEIYQKALFEGKIDYIKASRENSVDSVIACFPSYSWAACVYPDKDPEEALKMLWDHVINITRINTENPILSWENHKNNIREKIKYLDNLKIEKLFFSGPETDLTIGLIKNSTWTGGYYINKNSEQITPNIPTEEIFNCPSKYDVNGYIKTTIPLNYDGNLIDNAVFTFKDGKLIEYKAAVGENILKTIVDTDEGTRYLGEVALVSSNSPIFKTHKIFYTTLYDENAVCHIALGNSISSCIEGAFKLSPEEKDKIGLNVSLKHIDFMIGSDKINVDALSSDGRIVSLIKNGQWVV